MSIVSSALLCGALSAESLFLWQGEKAYVWRDVTNASPNLVVMKPSSPDAFVRTGVALPVRMENDRLICDRVVWGGSAAVPPGGAGRIVAEIVAPEGAAGPARVLCNGETFEYGLDVAPRKFPAAKDRRTFLDVWQHPWAVARLNQVKPFSKRHYDCMRPLWRELADAGQKVITTTIMDQPWAHQCFDAYGTMVRHIRLDSGGWRFDYSVFDEYVAFAKSCGLGPQIHCYSLCPFRLKRYSWEDEKGHTFAADFDIGSPEFIDYWTAFLNDFAAHLKAKGWFEDVYIALDERSPEELNAAVALAKRNGGFKIALAADRSPSGFSGVDIGTFSIALQYITDEYIAEARERRKLGKTTTFYTAGSNPCTSLRNPPEYCQWLGAFAGTMDLDGYLRWAFCSWPTRCTIRGSAAGTGRAPLTCIIQKGRRSAGWDCGTDSTSARRSRYSGRRAASARNSPDASRSFATRGATGSRMPPPSPISSAAPPPQPPRKAPSSLRSRSAKRRVGVFYKFMVKIVIACCGRVVYNIGVLKRSLAYV